MQSSSQDWARASSTCESTAALTPSKTTQRSRVGGAERHLEVESLCFLGMIAHREKIASLRIAAGTEHAHRNKRNPIEEGQRKSAACAIISVRSLANR